MSRLIEPKSHERGQALLEFALLAPLVILFLVAIVFAGIAVNRRVVLDHAVREGARFASVGGLAFSSGGLASCPELRAEIQQYVSAQAQGLISPAQIQVSFQDLDGNGIGAGDNVTVTVPYEVNLTGGLWSLDMTMNPSASARVERAIQNPQACT